jgi:hypothetical protein
MTDRDPPKLDAAKIPLNPIVQAAAESIATLYSTTIAAMSVDASTLVTKNGASNPPPNKSVKALTADMIALLGTRLRAVFPKVDTGTSESASPDDTETP